MKPEFESKFGQRLVCKCTVQGVRGMRVEAWENTFGKPDVAETLGEQHHGKQHRRANVEIMERILGHQPWNANLECKLGEELWGANLSSRLKKKTWEADLERQLGQHVWTTAL